jgi:hypothetical protein
MTIAAAALRNCSAAVPCSHSGVKRGSLAGLHGKADFFLSFEEAIVHALSIARPGLPLRLLPVAEQLSGFDGENL